MARATLISWLDDLRGDLSYAFRTLARSPAFAIVSILSLALGIGANTLAFSVVNALVLKPLPIARPSEVVFVQRVSVAAMSFPNYRDLRDRATAFAGLAGYRIAPMNIDAGGGGGAPPARATGNTWVIGRLKPGVSAAAAVANLNAIAVELEREYPDVNKSFRLKLTQPGFVGDALGQPVRAFTLGLLALAALVLLVACANL